jgi:hypothetical protein
MWGDRLAVYTTMYPGCERYLASWWESFCRQTDRDCDLWIGLDAMTAEQVQTQIGSALQAHWVPARPGDTPASLRQRAFDLLVRHYDKIVLVDADDLLEPTRVEAARQALDSVDVVASALRLVDEQERDLGLVFGPQHDVNLAALLVHHNVFGLSNSAYRACALSDCLPVPAACVLIDWLLATRASIAGASLRFDAVPRMAYRQYAHNCAPVVPPFTGQGVLTATERVVLHYRLLLESDWPWPDGARKPYLVAQRRAERFRESIRNDTDVLSRYVAKLNTLTPQFVWWWVVAHPELEHVWSR